MYVYMHMTCIYDIVHMYACIHMLLSDCNIWKRIHFEELFPEK